MVPVAAISNRRGKATAGFTLIEMLVVLFVVGLMAKTLMTTLSLSSGKLLQREADRLAWLLRENALQARASGNAVTWRPSAVGYEFLQHSRAAQMPLDRLDEKAEVRRYVFPEGIKVLSIRTGKDEPATQLLLSGRRIAGPSEITLANADEGIEVFSEGLDIFAVSSLQARVVNANR